MKLKTRVKHAGNGVKRTAKKAWRKIKITGRKIRK